MRGHLCIASVLALGLAPGCSLLLDLPEPAEEGSTQAATSSGAGGGSSGGSSTTSCDADSDSRKSEGPCGGDDCADNDPDVFPDQTKFFAARNKAGTFDYDCSGDPELEHPDATQCSRLPLSECEAVADGFLDSVPACGETGQWGGCREVQMTPLVTECQQRVEDTAFVMRCR
jgi:hypothetical protein